MLNYLRWPLSFLLLACTHDHENIELKWEALENANSLSCTKWPRYDQKILRLKSLVIDDSNPAAIQIEAQVLLRNSEQGWLSFRADQLEDDLNLSLTPDPRFKTPEELPEGTEVTAYKQGTSVYTAELVGDGLTSPSSLRVSIKNSAPQSSSIKDQLNLPMGHLHLGQPEWLGRRELPILLWPRWREGTKTIQALSLEQGKTLAEADLYEWGPLPEGSRVWGSFYAEKDKSIYVFASFPGELSESLNLCKLPT